MHQQGMTNQQQGMMNQPPYGIGQQQFGQIRQSAMSDGDMANAVLCELKRVAGEYATAAMEASQSQIRQVFEQLLHQTLSDQWQLFQQMSRLNLYGQPTQAHQQDIQQEAQKHRQMQQELQRFVRPIPAQGAGMPLAGMAGGAQGQTYSTQQHPQTPPRGGAIGGYAASATGAGSGAMHMTGNEAQGGQHTTGASDAGRQSQTGSGYLI